MSHSSEKVFKTVWAGGRQPPCQIFGQNCFIPLRKRATLWPFANLLLFALSGPKFGQARKRRLGHRLSFDLAHVKNQRVALRATSAREVSLDWLGCSPVLDKQGQHGCAITTVWGPARFRSSISVEACFAHISGLDFPFISSMFKGASSPVLLAFGFWNEETWLLVVEAKSRSCHLQHWLKQPHLRPTYRWQRTPCLPFSLQQPWLWRVVAATWRALKRGHAE